MTINRFKDDFFPAPDQDLFESLTQAPLADRLPRTGLPDQDLTQDSIRICCGRMPRCAGCPDRQITLTRQGVRDLGNDTRPRRHLPKQCDHRRLRSCCYTDGKPCGHILCPDCDLYIDVGFELHGGWRW